MNFLFSVGLQVFSNRTRRCELFEWLQALLIEEWCPFELKNPSLNLSLRSDLADSSANAQPDAASGAGAQSRAMAAAGGSGGGGGARASTPSLSLSSTMHAAALSPKVVFNFQWDKAVIADLDVGAAQSPELRATRERLDRFLKDELCAAAIVL